MSALTLTIRRPAASALDLPSLARAVREQLDDLAGFLDEADLDAETALETAATLHAVGGLMGRLAEKIETQGPAE